MLQNVFARSYPDEDKREIEVFITKNYMKVVEEVGIAARLFDREDIAKKQKFRTENEGGKV
ncbi:hypothetical protein IIB34_05385 [PVC group bacterium]|nr:hypothetical protein [PVC group bacterium]